MNTFKLKFEFIRFNFIEKRHLIVFFFNFISMIEVIQIDMIL